MKYQLIVHYTADGKWHKSAGTKKYNTREEAEDALEQLKFEGHEEARRGQVEVEECPDE